MTRASIFKGLGYLTSALSVLLLGVVSWKSASEQPLLFACLLVGMATSVLGMTLRWTSHRIEQQEKRELEAEVDGKRAGDARRPA
jgi:hypothetical protein